MIHARAAAMAYAESFYKLMLEVFDYLAAHGFTYYVISGSDRFICRSLKLGVEWREAGYHVISMRDDFKTIYGYWVQKVNFIF